MKNRRIIFDLDETIIDSKARLAMEIRASIECGLSEDEYWLAYRDLQARVGYDLFRYATLFYFCQLRNPRVDPSLLDRWRTIAAIPMFHPDAIPALNRFRKEEKSLITTGDPEFQKIKIESHGLAEHFQDTQIVRTPKAGHIIMVDCDTFFLDDSPREIDAMKRAHPNMFCIQVRSPAVWEHNRQSAWRDASATDLLEAADIIEQHSRS